MAMDGSKVTPTDGALTGVFTESKRETDSESDERATDVRNKIARKTIVHRARGRTIMGKRKACYSLFPRGSRRHACGVVGREPRLDMKAISKTLALVLRHKAKDYGIKIRSDGFCELNEVLRCSKMRKLGATRALLEHAVRVNPKRRFEIRDDDGQSMIRALQGHSMKGVQDEDLLRKMELTDDLPDKCVHGTYQRYWEGIRENGLLVGGTGSKVGRNHIHFAPYDYDDKQVISGMRKDCDVAIYLDLRKALAEGVPFYMSGNQVILTPGVEGSIPSDFVLKAINFKTGQTLLDRTGRSDRMCSHDGSRDEVAMGEMAPSSEHSSGASMPGKGVCVKRVGVEPETPCEVASKMRRVASGRVDRVNVKASTKNWAMSLMRGDCFLGENRAHTDKLNLLRSEQVNLGLGYTINMFTSRGAMRKEYKTQLREEFGQDWRQAVCQFCGKGPATKRCSQCSCLCCSRCIERELHGRCWRCLGYESAGRLGREQKRLEEQRKARQKELKGQLEWRYCDTTESFHFEQEEDDEDDAGGVEDLEYRDWLAPMALSARARLGVDEAEKMAAATMRDSSFDVLEITRILTTIDFPKSSRRKNVLPKGVSKVQGQLFGMYAHLQDVNITRATDDCTNTVKLLCAWLRHVDPGFRFTSIQINRNYASRPHVDKNNEGMSYIVSLGRFSGGEIWVHDGADPTVDNGVAGSVIRLMDDDVPEQYKAGELYHGRILDVFQRWTQFDGNRLHYTLPFEGERISLIFYANNRAAIAPMEVRARLHGLGFNFPEQAHVSSELLTDEKGEIEESSVQSEGNEDVPLAADSVPDEVFEREYSVHGILDRGHQASMLLCSTKVDRRWDENVIAACKECSWKTVESGHGRVLKTTDQRSYFSCGPNRVLERMVQEVTDMLKVGEGDTHDELHVYLDAGAEAETEANTFVRDIYSPSGIRDFTQPVRACVHFIVGQVTQFVSGQRRGAKCLYDEKLTDAVVVRPGDLVITDMNFNKTRSMSLGRSLFSQEPIVHVVMLWTRVTPRFLDRVREMGLRNGCHTCLTPMRYCGADVPSLAVARPRGTPEEPRLWESSVTVVNPSTFLRWAYNNAEKRDAWEILVARLAAKGPRSVRGMPSVETLWMLVREEWGDDVPGEVLERMRKIEGLARHLAQIKTNRLRTGEVSRSEVNRQESVERMSAKLKRLKALVMDSLAHALPVPDERTTNDSEKTDNLLRGIMFARPWCCDGEVEVYKRRCAKVYRTIYNLICEINPGCKISSATGIWASTSSRMCRVLESCYP